MTDLRNTVLDTMQRIASEHDLKMTSTLEDNTVLLESGLDSLGFAILVAELENILGYDPFVIMDNPVYPETLGEFVAVYELYKEHGV